jgi:hypothetical protein
MVYLWWNLNWIINCGGFKQAGDAGGFGYIHSYGVIKEKK